MTQTEVQPLTDAILENPVPFGIFLILLGTPVAFFGTKWFKYVCGGFGGFTGCLITAFTLQAFELAESDAWGIWTCLALAVLVGIIVGLLLFKFVTIGSILIGITFGAIVGVMLCAVIT